MSPSMFANGTDALSFFQLDRRYSGISGPGDEWSPSWQFPVVREMLSTLDKLTAAGQRYVMAKMVAFLRDQVEQALTGVSPRKQRMLSELLEHLSRNSERLWPDCDDFSHRAESLVALLVGIA